MAVFKCKICGGNLEVQEGMSVCECEYCGTRQTLPKMNDERRLNLYDRANHFRRNNEFDKAISMYEQILQEDKEDAEAYWSLVLCTYGIEYVEDPATHTRKPTVNRTQYTSVFADENYKAALRYADESQKAIYEEEARQIDEIQRGILDISSREEPFDVFICYKESDETGKRTPDSVLANDLYHQLTQEGFKVFFARITLEDKLGSAYEPYIFAALNSARVMVVLGTKPEYFQAVWVRNEWSRYLNLIKKGEKKVLIPAYKDMDPYDLPQEFSHLQAQDMGKLGFMQDLIRGIRKLTGTDERPQSGASAGGTGKETGALLKRAFMFLEDGDFAKADEYSEQVLNLDPENGEAYLGKLMVQCRVRKREELAQYGSRLDTADAFQKVMRFGGETLRTEVEGYNQQILETAYQKALQMLNTAGQSGQLKDVIRRLQELGEYKDAAAQIKLAQEKLEKISRKEQAKRKKKRIRLAVAVFAVALVMTVAVFVVNYKKAMQQAAAMIQRGNYSSAFRIYADKRGEEFARKKVVSGMAYEISTYVGEGSFSDAVALLAAMSDYQDDCTEEATQLGRAMYQKTLEDVESGDFSTVGRLQGALGSLPEGLDFTEEAAQLEKAMYLSLREDIEKEEYDAALQKAKNMVGLLAVDSMPEEAVQIKNLLIQSKLNCLKGAREEDAQTVSSVLLTFCGAWPEPETEAEKEREKLLMASVGDMVSFGTRFFGSGSAEWVVAEQNVNGEMLLVRKGTLPLSYRNEFSDVVSVDDEPSGLETGYSWENCSLRKKLNSSEFLEEYFTSEEQDMIVESTLTNILLRRSCVITYYNSGGQGATYKNLGYDMLNSTQDKVFVVSIMELPDNDKVLETLYEEGIGGGFLRDRTYTTITSSGQTEINSESPEIEINAYIYAGNSGDAIYGVRINPYLE